MSNDPDDYPIESWIVCGFVLMLGALLLQTVTVANERYELPLLAALGLQIAADSYFVAAFRCGGTRGKVVAAIFGIGSTLFVVGDFLMRAPYTYFKT